MTGRWTTGRASSGWDVRGASTIVSAIAIVIILAGVGVGTYAFMGGFGKSTPQSCEPITSPICGRFVNLHDVSLVLPFRSVQEGAGVPATISLPAGESSTSYKVVFGDNSTAIESANSTISHNYTSPGTYIVEASAMVNGQWHDNLPNLQILQVTPSIVAAQTGAVPGVSGTLIGNTTNPSGGRAVTAVLQPGESITVNGTYSSQPTNPAFSTLPPDLIAPGGTLSIPAGANTSTSISGTASFNAPGTYQVTFIGASTNATNVSAGVTFYSNYTWTVIVPPVGSHGGVAGQLIHRSPHPGQIINYELAPGGALSEDPAIDYETVGTEPILNIYQPLITYNGSLTGPAPNNYVPVLATCVPGSDQCTRMYGDSLQHGWNYTFVIQGNTSFYDPTTQHSWGVWPTDVLFSMARTLGFSTLPSTEVNNGWIIAQALLSSGNVTWDSIHAAYNNTPLNITNAITLNDTTAGDCPAAVLAPGSPDHGCVTFHAYGNKHYWPYFLELIADPLGGSIVPCGWFSAPNQAAGIPYWTAGNVSGDGDHPCAPMGSNGFGALPSTVPYTGWDQWEQLGSGAFGTYLGHVQYNMVGSGPYALSQYFIGSQYSLTANPAYGSNPYCTWKGCPPMRGNYAPNVAVTWETAATEGESAYLNGIADHASIPSTDFALLLELISQGKAVAVNAPTLTIAFEPFNLNFNFAGAQKLTTQSVSVPTDWFSYLGMREFFARAYPYETVQNTINTRDGIVLGFGMGGAIPQYMANYYPKGIPWPSTDPCTDINNPVCPSYWWDQMGKSGGVYYDPEIAYCSSANPCEFPMIGTTGSAAGDQVMQMWISEIQSLTGGAVKLTPVDINFVQLVINSQFGGPGQNPMPMYGLGWAPDYPDPTDYVGPLYQANNTYTYGDSVMQSLYVDRFAQASCPSNSDYNYYANNTFGDACQGRAYKAMLYALNLAATEPNLELRGMLYTLAEKVAYNLCLYTYTGQSNQVASEASWVDPSSINTNVTIGGGGVVPYFWLTGNDLQYVGST